MPDRLPLYALTLFAALWAQEAYAVVYVPGRYENGIYSRPHFLYPGEPTKAGLRLRQLVGSGAVAKDGPPAPEGEGPDASPPAAQPPRDER